MHSKLTSPEQRLKLRGRRFLVCSVFSLSVCHMFLIMPIEAYAIDESRLWLPVSQQKYYLDLKAAAESAEELDVCVTVLRGTLDREQSSVDHPIYRILCRRDDGVSYNEMVDGVTFETLTNVKRSSGELSEEELEKLLLEKLLRKKKYTKLCEEEFKHATRTMNKLQRLTPPNPEPDMYDGEVASYSYNFDAESMQRQPLHFSAICSVNQHGEVAVEIVRRK
jgi:hypothetical protein